MSQNDAQPDEGRVRLDSWKEIADYLNRDVRTVIRWEKERALPIHAITGGRRRSVFAFKDELDAWLARDGHHVLQEPPPAVAPTSDLLNRLRAASALPLRRAVGGALVFLVIAGAFVGWRLRRPLLERLGWAGPTLQRLAELDSPPFARTSPDGRFLAYQDGLHRIWVKGADSGQTRLLVPEGWEFVEEMAWSMDGRHLAFTSKNRSATSQIETFELSSQTRKVVWEGPNEKRPIPLDWSPDGKRLLCAIGLPDWQLQLAFLSLADHTLTPFLTLPPRTETPRLSPDGRFVIYAAPRGKNSDIFLAPVEGGTETRLTDHPANDYSPLWSPDGRWVVFLSMRRGSPDLWAVRTPSQSGNPVGEPVLLSALPAGSEPFALTLEGELFFSRRSSRGQAHLLNVNPETGVPQGEPQPLFVENMTDVTWSADGRKLYFREVPTEGTTRPAAEWDLRTGEKRIVPFPSSYVAIFLTHSRDGQSIVFYGFDPQEQKGIFEYRPQTGKIVALWTTQEFQNPPLSWSPDGKELLFSTAPGKDGLHAVRVLRPADKKLRTVASSTGRPFPQWSPNGKEIAYTDGTCLFAVPSAGGTARRITCAPRSVQPVGFGFMALGGLSWSPDGRKLAWTVHNEEQKRVELWIVDAASGSHVSWAGEAGYRSWPADPAWSPDGKQIAFRMGRKPAYEIWRLSYFLPR